VDPKAKRGKSQLDLSLETGISQKQLSFVESGRSVPNRQARMTIARVLDIPLRDRNTLCPADDAAEAVHAKLLAGSPRWRE